MTESLPAEIAIDVRPDGKVHDAPVIDVANPAPNGRPCSSCGSPVELSDRFCTACGTSHDMPTVSAADPSHIDRPAEVPTENLTHLRCENCGAEVTTDAAQRSYVCAFCDSTYVVEFSPKTTGRQRPEFVIGFAVTPEQALQKFRDWLGNNAWFHPSDLDRATIADKMKGVYIPFWSFSMLAHSQWSAEIGEYWQRRESYTTMVDGKMVRRTRTVTETEWWPLSGRHHHYYHGFLVSGSRGLPQQYAERIKPFQLPAMKRYEPYFLAGWLCEEYSVDRERALAVSKKVFLEQEHARVAAFMPGDRHHRLQVRTNFNEINSDLCLLPVYVLSYRYNNQLYRFLINGQTGKTAGDKPISKTKIAIAVSVGLAIVAAASIAILLLQ